MSRNFKATVGFALLITSLFSAGPASAEQLVTHSLSSTFNGAGSTGGALGSNVTEVAVDEATGYVYVHKSLVDLPISKFDADGVPTAFSGPALGGATTLTIPGVSPSGFSLADLAVDNSGTATQGRIYLSNGNSGGTLYAFEPDGEPADGYPIDVSQARGVAVDPSTGNLLILIGGGGGIKEYTPDGLPTGVEFDTDIERFAENIFFSEITIDGNGNFYTRFQALAEAISKFSPDGVRQYKLFQGADLTTDPISNHVFVLNAAGVTEYTPEGSKLPNFGSGLSIPRGIAANGTNGNVYVTRGAAGGTVSIFAPGPVVTVPDVQTGEAEEFEPTSVTVKGMTNPDGAATTDCRFEYGITTNYGQFAPCAEGNVLTGSTDQQVSAQISGLTQGQIYHFRLAVTNANGTVSGVDETFVPSGAPALGDEFVSDVHADSAVVHAEVNPEGASTTYAVEYGPDDCSSNPCQTSSSVDAGSDLNLRNLSLKVPGLTPGTTYHYRVVATNQSDSTFGPDRTFTTFPFVAQLSDPCPNSFVRQQTGAALLEDCRAYELVSAADTGGYNVESSLVPGETPYQGYPHAEDPSKVLYTVHNGAIPGIGAPNSFGLDPYVATRGADGWTTDYIGIPSDNPFATGPFSSAISEADPTLSMFAFGGPDICNPCFADGSTNIPLRLPDGSLGQGMTGSLDPGVVDPAGYVTRHFSANGSHFIFGTDAKLEPAGNEGGDVTIYDRNLETGTTQVVSTMPDGTTMTGTGVGALDVSTDGSRILVGEQVGEDADGNRYFDLYMHIGTSPNSVPVADTPSGVLFNGMTEDGTEVYFSTMDQLSGDTDTSGDLFRADVGTTGPSPITRISTGTEGTGDTDSCDPPGDPDDWNAAAGVGKCSIVAFAGGAGVAGEEGTVYFVSPERLDGAANGIQDQANLYVVRPGEAPDFVATIDSSLGKPGPQPAPLPELPLENPNFITGLSTPEAITVDQSTGDLYVFQKTSPPGVSRFDSTGAPKNFTAGADAGTNMLKTGLQFAGEVSVVQVAFDNAPSSLLEDTLYVSHGYTSPAPKQVSVFSSTGEELGKLLGGGTSFGSFALPCGVAIDQSSGVLYVGDYERHAIFRYEPTSGATPVSDANYTVTSVGVSFNPCHLAADTLGNVYAINWSGGPLRKFNASEFAPGAPVNKPGVLINSSAQSVTVDPSTNELYVNEGSQIAHFDSTGTLIQKFASGGVTGRGVAVSAEPAHIYATKGSAIVKHGIETFPVPPYAPVDHPGIVHGVSQSAVRDYEDIQVTADGRFAAFSSVLPLTGYDNDGNSEVFRFEAATGTLRCASCNPTNARAVGDAALASHGLGLLEDGRLFFNTTDGIAPRDVNERVDAYQWDEGAPQLVSPGSSAFDSRLLGVSADGTDAYFFTRDTLVPQDTNGDLVKIYDARAGGGFPFYSPPVPCKASDECHGPGSQAPGPAPIRTIKGTGGNHVRTGVKPRKCKRGQVRRRGRCQKRKTRHGKRGSKKRRSNRNGR